MDSFLKGKDLGLVSINKLEQLRKYIFEKEIERIQFEQVFIQIQKEILLEVKEPFQ